jgi:hypothetical protein
MKLLIRKTFYWIIAFVITLGASVYQRLTGPTYPLDVELTSGQERFSFELPRSHGGKTDCPVEIALPVRFSGEIIYRRFPTSEKWDTIQLHRLDDKLIAFLPNQPPAGKLEYHINLKENGELRTLDLDENVVIRFKGDVPNSALIPHVIFMFLAMLWSNATGLQAAAKISSYRRNALITVVLFIVGGLIFGPVVQKHAFGAYWTGWPFGEDLTDNKVLAAVIVWITALLMNRNKDRRWLVITAALFLFAIYMIPHSMRGSELDYSSGEVVTGMIVMIVPAGLLLAETTPVRYLRSIIKRRSET